MIDEWGLLGLCIICFVSATIVPFPSEAAFIYCLALGYNEFAVFSCAIVFNSLGGSTNYLIGYYGRKWSKKENIKAESIVRKVGVYAALFSWVPFIGDPLLIVLGIYRTKPLPTFILMVIGKAARYAFCYYSFKLVVL